MACDFDGLSHPPLSAARRPVQPYKPELHDKWLSSDLKQAAERIARELWNKPDRKQTRIAFEKYVTHCIVLHSLQVKAESVVMVTDATSDEQSEHPFVDQIPSLDDMAADPSSTAVLWPSTIEHAIAPAATEESMRHSVGKVLPPPVECDETMRAAEATPATPIVSAKSCATVRAAEASFAELWASLPSPSPSVADTMRWLRKTNVPLYAQVLSSHREVEQAAVVSPPVVSALESVPRSAWVTVFDSCLWGPFSSSAEATSFVRRYAMHPRTPITWQVGMQDCDAGMLDTVTIQPPETPIATGTRLEDHTSAAFRGDSRPCTDIFVAAKGYDSDDDSASDGVEMKVALFDTGSAFDLVLPQLLFMLVTDTTDWVKTRLMTATLGADTYKAPVIMQELWAEHTGILPSAVQRRVTAYLHPKPTQTYAIVGPSALLPLGEFILRADGVPTFARASY